MGCLYDRLKNGLGDEVSSHFTCNKYLSITRWSQALGWLCWEIKPDTVIRWKFRELSLYKLDIHYI